MRVGAGAGLRHRSLEFLSRRLGTPAPSLGLRFWDGERFDFAPAPAVVLTLRTPLVLRRMLTGDMARLAQAYVEGDIIVDGRLQDVLGVGVTLAERIGRLGPVRRLKPLLARMPRRHSRGRDAAAIRHHYDVSNDFYALWLDARMIYSCAYFRTGQERLDAAQEQKLDHICRKLRLASDEGLLDIGCGWGGLVCWAARNYGVRAVGVTISEQQFDHARELIVAEGLSDRVEIRLQDYRDIPGEGCFDKVVSVGMYEHVGLANLPRYFGAMFRLLKPGGLALNHGITTRSPDSRVHGPPDGGYIERYVFPGGELPHISRVLHEMAASGLEIADLEDLRPHYPPTLLHWVRRLEARKAEAIEAAGEQRYRVWRMYMAGMAWAFDRGLLSVDQVLAYKPDTGRMAPRPWTREYQYVLGRAAPMVTGLEWGNL